MVLCYRALARMARRFSLRAEAKLWRAKGESLAARINERLFDLETGAYLDRRRDTGKFSGY